jgi:hypothetical protein
MTQKLSTTLIEIAKQKIQEGGQPALDAWLKTLAQPERLQLSMELYEAAIRLDERIQVINQYFGPQ